jgi:hypothetical protein
MADIIINTENKTGFSSIYDNYENTEGIFFRLEKTEFFNLFRDGKIRFYVKNGENWQQLNCSNTHEDIFYISLHNNIFSLKNHDLGRLIDIKYESDLGKIKPELIRLHPYRIFCGMEFLHSLPKTVLSLALIVCALVIECISLAIIKIKTPENKVQNLPQNNEI